MEWINVKNSLPKPWQVVWIYWRNREVLFGCRTNEDDDPTEGWYSFEDRKCKCTHLWMPINVETYDGPQPPLLNPLSESPVSA